MLWRSSAIFSVTVALLGGGCHGTPFGHTSPHFADWSDPSLTRAEPLSENIIRPGDVIDICVDHPVNAQGSNVMRYIVKTDGTVTFLSNRLFTAAGKTLGEFEREVRKDYGPGFFPPSTIEPPPYTVDGEVKVPGRQPYIGPLTVSQAIESAGGFTKTANQRKVQLIRSGRTYLINISKARKASVLDMQVFPGDRIFVPRSLWKW